MMITIDDFKDILNKLPETSKLLNDLILGKVKLFTDDYQLKEHLQIEISSVNTSKANETTTYSITTDNEHISIFIATNKYIANKSTNIERIETYSMTNTSLKKAVSTIKTYKAGKSKELEATLSEEVFAITKDKNLIEMEKVENVFRNSTDPSREYHKSNSYKRFSINSPYILIDQRYLSTPNYEFAINILCYEDNRLFKSYNLLTNNSITSLSKTEKEEFLNGRSAIIADLDLNSKVNSLQFVKKQ